MFGHLLWLLLHVSMSAMPKLCHNVVNCQDRNISITYLKTRNCCRKNGVRHPLVASGNMSNAHFEDDTVHAEDACFSNKDIGIWFDALRILCRD
ncbi:unnamed protein product [Bathycoccus prasinos]